MTSVAVEAEDKETAFQRNPHVDFASVEASRPAYDSTQSWLPTKTPNPGWQPGDGSSTDEWKEHQIVSIDPNSPTRTITQNYKLMISSTVPRPIALVSTVTADGLVQNLAPFSYFNNVSNDPPLYSLAFHGEKANDSLQNIMDTGELCISIVSDWLIEAMNFSSVNTPPEISEWDLAGLHPSKSQVVKAPYVAENCVFNEDGLPKKTATLALVEVVMFHVREDAVDEKRETVDIKVLRPVWRGGGITYGSCFGGWETPRPDPFRILRESQAVKRLLESDKML